MRGRVKAGFPREKVGFIPTFRRESSFGWKTQKQGKVINDLDR
jgi:hypothetical protein